MVGLYNGLWMSFTHLPHSPSSTTLNAAFTTKGLCTFSNSSNQKSKSARLPEAATPRSLATACETLGRGKHCAARQPPKATLRSLERRRLACETPVDGNILVRNKILPPAQPTQAVVISSASFCGGGDAGEDACFPGWRRGGDSGKKLPTPMLCRGLCVFSRGFLHFGRIWRFYC